MSRRKRVAVTGSRSFADAAHVTKVLDLVLREHGPFTLVEGGATGADSLARQWAEYTSKITWVYIDPFPADWARHGKAAGPIRNQEMIDSGLDLLVAFPGGRGTADMVRRAKKARVPILYSRKVLSGGAS